MEEEILKGENWSRLPATEKEKYMEFHRRAYSEDLKHSEATIFNSPRWSIISGYYAMYDITRLFLAKKFDVKIGAPRSHVKTILALEHFLKDESLQKRILELLKGADTAYLNVERLKEKSIPLLLKRGRQERSKSQYYTKSPETDAGAQKAVYFFDNIVKPYTCIMEELCGGKHAD